MNWQLPTFFGKYLYFFVHMKGMFMGTFGKKYYSQWGEDIVVNQFFSGQKDGLYVDVGAYHPLHYSNTYLLHKRGWRGINIDPNPNSIRLFNWHRRQDININAGIDTKVTTQPYFVFTHQSCNTFSVEQKNKILQKKFIQLIKEIPVDCVPLQTLLDKHFVNKKIDFLNIDVEGMGVFVLRSIDWARTRPKVICIEDDEFNFKNSDYFGSEIFLFLTQKSYRLFSRVGLSCIYSAE